MIAAEKSFQEAFKALECASWTQEELRRYEAIEKAVLDNLSAEDQRIIDAKEEGKKEGVEETKLEIAKAMQRDGVDLEVIKKHTEIAPSRLA